MNSRLFIPRSEIRPNNPLTRRTERPSGGDDYVGFVPAEPVLGVNAALRVVRRMSLWAERRIDEESMLVRKDSLVKRRLVGS